MDRCVKWFLLQELLILSCLLTDDSSRGPFEYDGFHVDRDTAAYLDELVESSMRSAGSKHGRIIS